MKLDMIIYYENGRIDNFSVPLQTEGLSADEVTKDLEELKSFLKEFTKYSYLQFDVSENQTKLIDPKKVQSIEYTVYK